MRVKGSSCFLRNDFWGVANDSAELPSDEEIGIESEPLSDLHNIDTESLFSNVVHKESVDGDKEQGKDASVDDWLVGLFELRSVSGHKVDYSIDVENLTTGEDLGGKHVVVHVVVAIEEANQGSEDEGGSGCD